ncbi:MAG: hypothetical protein AB1921_19110 [Thermodesulfobacteriota bacterium]
MKPRLPYTAFRLADARLALAGSRSSLWRVFHPGGSGPARIDLLLIARRTRAVSSAVTSLCDSFVTQNVRRHDKMLKKAREASARAGSKPNGSSKAFGDLLDQVGRMAAFFRDLDRRGPRIRSRLLWAFGQVGGMEQEQKKALFREKAYRAQLSKKLRELPSAGASPAQAVRAQALQARLGLCEKRIEMLTDFFAAFASVRPAMNHAAGNVDHFLTLVRENRRVFEEAEATLAMKRDFDAALFSLSSEQEFSRIEAGMEKSFSELADAERMLLAKAGERE